MTKKPISELIEGFALAGTLLFSQKADAEATAKILGVSGAFPLQCDGIFWMPGKSYDDLMEQLYVLLDTEGRT